MAHCGLRKNLQILSKIGRSHSWRKVMRISRISVKNFRAIENQTIELEPYNTFVGANGAGKSSVLGALNLFFGELDVKRISERDFFEKDISKAIEISVTFDQLSEIALEEFDHYVRSGEMTVVVEVSMANGNPVKEVRGERLVFKPFATFHEGENAADRATRYDELRKSFPELPEVKNDGARKEALSAYEEELPASEKELVRSDDQFFGATKGQSKLKKFVQWVHIPAVKDAANEGEEGRTSYLSKLMGVVVKNRLDHHSQKLEIQESVIASFDVMLNEQQRHLDDLNERLSSRLREAFTSEVGLKLTWKKGDAVIEIPDPEAIIELEDRNFVGKVENFGHGLQRTFLIVLLQEIASLDAENVPTLILGCDEPELYQHPTQARHLAKILGSLANNGAQVLITTHSPNFVNVEHYEGIRRFSNADGKLVVSSSTFDELWNSYNAAFSKPLPSDDADKAQLQIKAKLAIQTLPKFNDIFFVERAVLVEGISDQACFNTLIDAKGMRSQFQRLGLDILSCDGKSNLAFLKLIADEFEIPAFVVFDCDYDQATSSEQPGDGSRRQYHEQDNSAIFNLCGYELNGGFPDSDLIQDNFVAWKNDIEDVIKMDCGDHFESAKSRASIAVGQLADAKKNPLFVAVLVQEAAHSGCKFPRLSEALSKMI